MTLPSIKAVGIARRVGRRRRAKSRLIPTVILHGRWYDTCCTICLCQSTSASGASRLGSVPKLMTFGGGDVAVQGTSLKRMGMRTFAIKIEFAQKFIEILHCEVFIFTEMFL
jgi:hypothetical protein